MYSNCSFQMVKGCPIGLVVRAPAPEREVVGTIPGRYRQKSLKLIVVAFSLSTQDYGNSTMTGQPVSG